MDEKTKKKGHYLLTLVAILMLFSGIIVYAYNFPSTFELFDKKINEFIELSGKEGNIKVFTAFYEFSEKAVNESIYWVEVITDNIKGTFDGIKPVPSFIMSCAAYYPTDFGSITSLFGKRKDPFSGENSVHSGIDIAVSEGSGVLSAWPGRISETGFNAIYGNYVMIEHSKNFYTKYCHLSKICAERGDMINAKEKIGEAGSTGRSTGSHLHFEVIIDGRNVDPMECFEL